MNKEIEKAKEDLSFMNEGDYVTKEMEHSARVLEEYIKELENEKTILDKVTYKLKELDFRLYLQKEEDKIAGKDINTIINVRLDLEEILNIIEGEKNNANRRKRRR